MTVEPKRFDVILLARRLANVDAPETAKYGEVIYCPDANGGQGAMFIGGPDNTPRPWPGAGPVTPAAPSPIATGPTPPDDGRQMWTQTDANGIVLDHWQLAPDGETWVSRQVREYGYATSGSPSSSNKINNPIYTPRTWIESLVLIFLPKRAFGAGQYHRFTIGLISDRGSETPFVEHSPEGLPQSRYSTNETINRLVNSADCLQFNFRVNKVGNTPPIKQLTYRLRLRRVYEPEVSE